MNKTMMSKINGAKTERGKTEELLSSLSAMEMVIKMR
jgi:hypothetical protein